MMDECGNGGMKLSTEEGGVRRIPSHVLLTMYSSLILFLIKEEYVVIISSALLDGVKYYFGTDALIIW